MKSTLIYTYIEDIAKRIHDPALHGAASVMVGAGFSKNADIVDDEISAPNWEELAQTMFESLYEKPNNEDAIRKWEIQKIKKTSGKNVLKLAEEYKSVFGRNKLNKFIEANINDEKYIPGDLHKKLLSLKWRDVFTTNYDTLLERTIDKINVKFNYKILTNQNDLPGSIHPRIIKLHGSVDSAKHYIICEEDYRIYPIQYAPLVNTVQQAMLETQLCLIGFSGDDPNFLSWLGWLRDNMGENCPTIYLVGLFKNMSVAERMTLENQNITILDLADMFDNNKDDIGHQEALDTFLNKLSEYGKVKEKVFESVPFKDLIFKSDFHKSINDEYFDAMDSFLSKMKEKTNGYLAFQNSQETINFINSISNHFKELLKLEPNTRQVNTLSKIVYLLRKSYTILEDPDANKLAKLVDSIEVEKFMGDKALLASWVDLSLYLLEMYRVDGRNKEYKELLTKVEKEVVILDGITKEELQIEKCKFLISSFDYSKAAREIEKINQSVALDIQLKKIFLYKQIGEEEKGIELLRNASAILAQKKYSENKIASLKGYLNLCARSLMSGRRESYDDSFSDEDYYSNSYNVRNIYNQIKNDVSSSLLLAHNESRGENPGFNPGTYKVTYGTATRKEQDAVTHPLKYVMFQDLLCLPNTFSDHKEILSLALKGIIHTSENPIWKWSSIIRTNDLKIINSFFKRELIVSSEKEWIQIISEQLFKLVDNFDKGDIFNRKNRIITQETIYDILSRFSIVMENDKIIILSEKILEISNKLDEFDSRKLVEFFGRIRFSINSYVLSYFFYELLKSDTIPSWFLFAFIDIDTNIESFEIPDDVFKKIIDEIKSQDGEIRDKGITKIMLIDSTSNLIKYNDKVAEALWGQKDDIGFPKTNNFYVWVWGNLPFPDDINLRDLYMKYLESPKFIKSVNGGTISGIPTIDNPINEYIQCFRRASDFGENREASFDFTWNSDYFVKIIRYIYEYMDNEKSLLTLKFDIFGSEREAKKRFIKLADFVAMLVAQAYLSDVYTSEIAIEVQRFKELLQDNGISSSSIEITEKVIVNENIEMDIEGLMNRAVIGDRDKLSQAMSIIKLLLTFERNSINNVMVSEHVIELLNSIKYFDLSRSNIVISRLIAVIDHPIFIQEEYRSEIINVFRQNKDKLNLSFNKSDRELIDTIYSLSILIRRYYNSLVEHKICIPENLEVIIEELSQSNLKEVRYMWEDSIILEKTLT